MRWRLCIRNFVIVHCRYPRKRIVHRIMILRGFGGRRCGWQRVWWVRGRRYLVRGLAEGWAGGDYGEEKDGNDVLSSWYCHFGNSSEWHSLSLYRIYRLMGCLNSFAGQLIRQSLLCLLKIGFFKSDIFNERDLEKWKSQRRLVNGSLQQVIPQEQRKNHSSKGNKEGKKPVGTTSRQQV